MTTLISAFSGVVEYKIVGHIEIHMRTPNTHSAIDHPTNVKVKSTQENLTEQLETVTNNDVDPERV